MLLGSAGAIAVTAVLVGCGGNSGIQDQLAWANIPNLVFTVGVPVNVDLRGYLTDPSGTATITLDGALPAGLTFSDGVISGTPAMETAAQPYTATADDGR